MTNDPRAPSESQTTGILSESEFNEMIGHIRAASIVAMGLAILVVVYWGFWGRFQQSILPLGTGTIAAIEFTVYSSFAVLVYGLSRMACATLLALHVGILCIALINRNPVGLIEIVLVFVLYRSMKQSFRLHALLQLAKAQA